MFHDRDEITTHKIPYFDNFVIVSRDPVYHHWIARLERGETPKAFDGYWTDLGMLKRVVETTQNARKKKVA